MHLTLTDSTLIPDTLYNEAVLIHLISQGDENAFAKLFEHYRDKIYSIALKLTRSNTLAEEIVEDVFLKIWLKRSSLGEIQNFRAYLFTITRNDVYKILKQISKNYKIALLTDNNPSLAHNDTEDYIMEKEYSSLLQRAIDRLPKQQKQVYQLMKEQGLKREEAADFLHLQPETVKFHLAQAMKNIRSFCTLYLDMMTGIIFFLFSSNI
ncbi:RNA polymerase sigma-70 factor [Chitinophaga sp. MM2321]|uniref:RNA polymerase sigma factor n=1 Tax=Chitinophaga sp. MM2321 TaxID=3137178 RepID=UPI0032D57BAB